MMMRARMTLLDEVRLSLRIASPVFDDEINGLIAACRQDLILAGIMPSKVKKPDALINRAVTLYAKAHFGFADDGEKYQKSYDALKISLCLAGDYNDRGNDDEGNKAMRNKSRKPGRE